jgi:hypothetical protein
MRILKYGLLLIVGGGCQSSAVVMKTAPPKGSSCPIEIFSSAVEVKRPYESLCMVSAEVAGVAGGQGNTNIVMNKAKSRACECGADALIITELTLKSGAQLTATAIRFTDK